MYEALVQIVRADGTVAGNGFLEASGHVVTCAHVVAACFSGTSDRDAAAPGGEVAVRFFRADGHPSARASVAAGGWFPDHDRAGGDGLTDIAVLRLKEEVGDVLRLAIATRSKDSFEGRLYPFLPATGMDGEIEGAVTDYVSSIGKRRFKAHKDFTQFVEPGCSGTPVFVHQGEQVEGIIEIRDKANLEALFSPASAIRIAIDRVTTLAATEPAGFAAGLNEAQIRSILQSFGVSGAPADQAESTLLKKAEELKAFRERLSALSNEDPRLKPYRDRAQIALKEGRFDEAASVLAEAERIVDAALLELQQSVDQRKREKAELREGQAEAKRLALAYLDAARLYREAADLLPASDREEWARLRFAEGSALDDYGRLHAGLEHLGDAVTAYDAALTVRTERAMPAEWAMTQNNKGNVLRVLGERQGGEAGLGSLQAAVEAYDAALTVRTESAMPADWAATQNNKGIVLGILGARRGGEAGLRSLQAAVEAYDAALTVRTESAMPAEWAATQNNKGNVLGILGERQGGEAGLRSLQAAVEAYDAALTVLTESAMPAQWAMTQNNKGNVLGILGERQGGEAGLRSLQAAVEAYDAALTVRTESAMPAQWAITQNNKGTVLGVLGERQGGEAGLRSLQAAVEAYEAALTVLTESAMPADWALTKENEAIAEHAIATLSAGDDRRSALGRALAAVDDALRIYRTGGMEYDLGTAENLRQTILDAMQGPANGKT